MASGKSPDLESRIVRALSSPMSWSVLLNVFEKEQPGVLRDALKSLQARGDVSEVAGEFSAVASAPPAPASPAAVPCPTDRDKAPAWFLLRYGLHLDRVGSAEYGPEWWIWQAIRAAAQVVKPRGDMQPGILRVTSWRGKSTDPIDAAPPTDAITSEEIVPAPKRALHSDDELHEARAEHYGLRGLTTPKRPARRETLEAVQFVETLRQGQGSESFPAMALEDIWLLAWAVGCSFARRNDDLHTVRERLRANPWFPVPRISRR